jgi:hypothetical protein
MAREQNCLHSLLPFASACRLRPVIIGPVIIGPVIIDTCAPL